MTMRKAVLVVIAPISFGLQVLGASLPSMGIGLNWRGMLVVCYSLVALDVAVVDFLVYLTHRKTLFTNDILLALFSVPAAISYIVQSPIWRYRWEHEQ